VVVVAVDRRHHHPMEVRRRTDPAGTKDPTMDGNKTMDANKIMDVGVVEDAEVDVVAEDAVVVAAVDGGTITTVVAVTTIGSDHGRSGVDRTARFPSLPVQR
jgi:hypothetical protein